MTGPCSIDGCDKVTVRAHGDPDVVKTPGRKAAPPLVVIQCPDCGQTVGLADDRRSVWDAIAAHSCQVVA